MDIGCGPGTVVGELIAAYGPEIPKEARIIAADLSPGMIEQVRQRQSHDAAWAKVEPAVYDAMNLSALEDGSLSHVLSGFTIFLLPDHRKGMLEALRVIETGGIFAFTSMARSSWSELMQKITEVRPEKKVPQPAPMWRTEEGVKGELDGAGFKESQAYSVPIYMPFEDPTEIVDYLMSTMPFMPMVTKDMTTEEISRARDLMIQHVKEEYADGKLPGIAILGIGKK
jgi:SAM-dependent methyltransferase